MSTQAHQAKVMYDNGFVDIVLEDGSVLSLKIDDRVPGLDRYDSVLDHVLEMGADQEDIPNYCKGKVVL